MRELAEIAWELERPREAGFIHLYLHELDRAREAFSAGGGAADRALTFDVEGRYQEAARLSEEAGLLAHATVASERGGDLAAAAAGWEQLAGDPRLGDWPYERALVASNRAVAQHRIAEDPAAEIEAFLEARRDLEKLAAEAAAAGNRARTFDCYLTLIRNAGVSGERQGIDEIHRACIGLLADSKHELAVFQHYRALIEVLRESGDLEAAAAAESEAREYARDTSWGPELPGAAERLAPAVLAAEVWFLDLLEWELDGDPGRVAASLVGDRRYPVGIRRRALVLVLSIAETKREEIGEIEGLCRFARHLGELRAYPAAAALERLYRHEDPAVRRAAVEGHRWLAYQRSFALVRDALGDPDHRVRETARCVLGYFHIPAAFHTLYEIYDQSSELEVRAAAIEAIATTGHDRAPSFLLEVAREEGGALQWMARQALAWLGASDDEVPPQREGPELPEGSEIWCPACLSTRPPVGGECPDCGIRLE
jgi:hypothetical protein